MMTSGIKIRRTEAASTRAMTTLATTRPMAEREMGTRTVMETRMANMITMTTTAAMMLTRLSIVRVYEQGIGWV
jgi:hypothetical protein